MRKLLKSTMLAIVVLVIPGAALADVSGTVTLTANQSLNLVTGTQAASGGDLLWNASAIVPQGSATAVAGAPYGFSGASEFIYLARQGPTTVSTFAPFFSNAPIPTGSGAGTIFLCKTNGGYYAVVLVTALAQDQSSITLQFITFTTLPFVPLIENVLNNYGLIPAYFSNSGIALGSLFIIRGVELASSTTAVLQSSAAPGIPVTLNGASVSVTVNGTTTHPGFYYATASQLALVMPSNTPTGNGAVTVTYNGQTSAPFGINVVASSFGFDTYYGTGSGLAVATNPSTGAYYNYSNSVPPGVAITMWGSGLGADPTRDTTYSTSNFALTIGALQAVYVGGIQAEIQYQGASGYPGVNQVNVLIPADAPTGCFVSVVGVTTTGIPTNIVTLPIGTGECKDPGWGFSGSTLTNLTGMTNVNIGYVEMSQTTMPAFGNGRTQVTTAASAAFDTYAGSRYATGGIVSAGGCIVTDNLPIISLGPQPSLNAGTITVSPPNGLAPVALRLAVSYGELLSPTVTASGGMFQFQATGGTQIGAFTTSVNFPTPLLNWINQPILGIVTRSEGLTVTWSGGAPGTYVFITGTSSGLVPSRTFRCLAPVEAGAYTVPGYVLAALPASPTDTTGSLSVGNQMVPQTFTATGLDYGYAMGVVSYQINATYR